MKLGFTKFQINKKQLGVTLVLLGLMAMLISGEFLFKDRLKEVALVDTEMSIMKLITSSEGRVSYKLPESWSYSEKSFPDDGIIHYSEYSSKDKSIIGYASVAKSYVTIEELLKSDREKEEKSYKVEEYCSEEGKLKERPFYAVSYEFTAEGLGTYIAREYYLSYDDLVVKLSFYIAKEKYKENMTVAFGNILESFTLNK